jgi:hypothetical protein
LDAFHHREPFKNRKALLSPLEPLNLASTLATTAALQTMLLLLEAEKPAAGGAGAGSGAGSALAAQAAQAEQLALPGAEATPQVWAAFLAGRFAEPFGKDLCRQLLTRQLEAAARMWCSGSGSAAEQGAWTREPGAAATDALAIRERAPAGPGGARSGWLLVRWDVAVHMLTAVLPRTAAIEQLAFLAVEQLWLLGKA